MSTTQVVVFPFDLFGSAGCGAGAQLLGDAIQEAIDDTQQEPRPTRPLAFVSNLDCEEFPFETLDHIQSWRTTGREAIRSYLADGQFVLWLGGNHLSVLPIYDELTPRDLVLQFDAHLDCYQLHDTTEELCHGNFLLHRTKPGPEIIQLGHRDLFLTPAETGTQFAEVYPAEDWPVDPLALAGSLQKAIRKAKRVWIDLDIDVFDPAFAPAVHTPSPFGLSPHQVWNLIQAVWSPKVVGVSISEFDPGRDSRDQTLNLLGWLTERLLLLRHEVGP